MGNKQGNSSDITERQFGRLTAIEPTNIRSGGHIVWKCQCECGNIAFVDSNALKKGNTRSCGCLIQTRDFTRKGILDRFIQKGYNVEPFGRYGIVFISGDEIYGLQLQDLIDNARSQGMSKDELDNVIIERVKKKINIE